jgi:hypothetical protein
VIVSRHFLQYFILSVEETKVSSPLTEIPLHYEVRIKILFACLTNQTEGYLRQFIFTEQDLIIGYQLQCRSC